MGLFRLLLAACVLFGHSQRPGGLNWLPAGTAVEAFFVVSGFYMQLILSEKYTRQRLGNSWRLNFYVARYTRLFPTYAIGLALTCIAGVLFLRISHHAVPPMSTWATLSGLKPSFRNVALWIGTVFANITIFLQDLGGVLAVRDGHAVFTWDRNASEIYVWSALAITQAWSLGVELLFYLLAPFLLTGSDRRLLLWFTLGIVVRAAAVLFLGGDLPYRMFPFVLSDFLGGALAYRYGFALVRLLGKNARIAAYAGMLIIVAGLPSSLTSAQVSSIALVLTIFTVPALFDATKKNAVDALLGELSYPFYIFHVLCLDMAGFVLQRLGVATSGVLVSAALGATLLVSFILVRLELRFLEPWRKRLGHEPAGIVLAFKAREPKHGIVRSEQV
jgi:peptidoglycan/LPS O-acetylase OafA/YrhL